MLAFFQISFNLFGPVRERNHWSDLAVIKIPKSTFQYLDYNRYINRSLLQ